MSAKQKIRIRLKAFRLQADRPVGSGNRGHRQAHGRHRQRPRAPADAHAAFRHPALSPHVNKTSRDQFEIRTHQRLMDIVDPHRQDRGRADEARPAGRRGRRDQAAVNAAACEAGHLRDCPQRLYSRAFPLFASARRRHYPPRAIDPGIVNKAPHNRWVLEKTMSMSEQLGLLGRKVGMTRIFTDDGDTIPVTVLDVSNKPRHASQDRCDRRLQRTASCVRNPQGQPCHQARSRAPGQGRRRSR